MSILNYPGVQLYRYDAIFMCNNKENDSEMSPVLINERDTFVCPINVMYP